MPAFVLYMRTCAYNHTDTHLGASAHMSTMHTHPLLEVIELLVVAIMCQGLSNDFSLEVLS